MQDLTHQADKARVVLSGLDEGVYALQILPHQPPPAWHELVTIFGSGAEACAWLAQPESSALHQRYLACSEIAAVQNASRQHSGDPRSESARRPNNSI